MKPAIISLFAVSIAALSSCKEKSAEVKRVEDATAKAVESGTMTKEQAKSVNNAAEKADDMKEEAKKSIADQLEKLNKASTVDEMRAAVKDATKANVDLAVKAGAMTKDQADLSLKQLDSIDAIPEASLKPMVEQLRTTLTQALNAAN